MTTITPSPLHLAKFAKAPAPAPAPVVLAATEPADPGKIVRPGFVEQFTEVMHDGVIKAKEVKPGMVVQAWLNDGPRGGKRTVESAEFDRDSGLVTIEFSTAHPVTEYKAAYRFFVQALVGTVIVKKSHVPALVAYQEV